MSANPILAGKYEVLGELARGGMGVVYLARPLDAEVQVAVKVVQRTDEASLGRFRREVFVSQRVQHPSVVRIHDAGNLPDGTAFMVMDLLRGETLQERLDLEGRLPPEMCLDRLEELLRALAAVHAVRVVHRDLKPENLHLEPDGDGERLTIVDFGVSRVLDEEVVAREALFTSVEEELSGTPQYVAPEALTQPGSITTAHDVYACGVIFFEMLTGRLPYPIPKSLSHLLADVISASVPALDEACPDAAPFAAPYEWLARKLLEKDDLIRPSDAAAALEVVTETRARLAKGAKGRSGISQRLRRFLKGGET